MRLARRVLIQGLMRSAVWFFNLLLAASAAAVDIPLTVQETLYPGSIPGLKRTAEPVTVGVPLPDDAASGAMDVRSFNIRGAAAGQFRVLGRWPSGRIQWVLVDTQADVAAGRVNTALALTSDGAGNYGGRNLASDTGPAITVDTGAATFVIRKAHFNGFDQVIAGNRTLVSPGSSQGLVVTGPPPGQTACPPCTTVYASANDPGSTAVIEENGPVRAVIKASGQHVDASGNAYMGFTVRMHFYKGKSSVKFTSVLRNAGYGGANSFESAYKGFDAYELRVQAALAGAPRYTIGTHGSPVEGALGAGDSVELYQAASQLMKWQDWCGFGCLPYTKGSGYVVLRNGVVAASGKETQYPPGWADVTGSDGAGLSVGVYQFAAYWPKSLEFRGGGSDVRIGIWPAQTVEPYYQPWPQWSIHDLFIDFHARAGESPGTEFLKFQHYLAGRASRAHYNASRVFPYPVADPAVEDRFYKATAAQAKPSLSASSACCIEDVGTRDPAWPLNIFRFYAWGAGGGANQAEFRWSYLLNYLARGMTGRYLNAAHFYRFQAESMLPHSDGFDWRDKHGEYDGFGRPHATSANANLAFRNWRDQEHGHWYGMTDFYFMTGDETVREAMLDQAKDWFMNANTYQSGQAGGLFNTRSVGVQLMGAARFYKFLQAIGDRDAGAVLAQGAATYFTQVKPELCLSGYPAGCVLGKADGGPWDTQGVSRTRGVHWGASGTSGTWCGVPHAYRVNSSFQPAILIQGLLEFRAAAGPRWSEYINALDLAYGLAQWNLTENYVDDGSGRWDSNGFRFGIALDVPNSCTRPGESPEPNFAPVATQTTSMTFLAKYLVEGSTGWSQKFRINMQKAMAALGRNTSEFGGYQLGTIIDLLSSPPAARLTDVPLRKVEDRGNGTYLLEWVVPEGARNYRVKWAPEKIVEWIGFDPARNVFTGDPALTTAWFAAVNVPGPPPPAPPGTSQQWTVVTGTPGLQAEHFSVKAYVVVPGSRGVQAVSEAPDDAPAAAVPAAAPPDARPPAREPAPVAEGVRPPAAKPSGAAAKAGPSWSIRWTKQPVTPGWPGYNGWHTIWYDPVSRQTILYGILSDATTIYSTDLFFYRADTNTWTHRGGTGSKSNACPPSRPDQPGDRHPVWQMAIDTKREYLWLFGGVCQNLPRQDMYYLKLQRDPLKSVWTSVQPQHFAAANLWSAMAYDPDADVLFLFGSDGGPQTHNNWVYCRTTENPNPAALTEKQVAAGCTRPNDWAEVAVAGGVRPPGVASPGLVYDPVTRKMIQFGGLSSGLGPQNETWAYDVQGRKWTRKALGSTPPPIDTRTTSGQPAMVYVPRIRQILYHQTGGSGAPADWLYDPAADRWTRISSEGGGASIDQVLAYDTENDLVIGFNRDIATGVAEVWHGRLTPLSGAGH